MLSSPREVRAFCVLSGALCLLVLKTLTTINVTRYSVDMDTIVSDTSAAAPLPRTAREACAPGSSCAPPTLSMTQAMTLAERLKTLADPTRLGILDLLLQQERPLCVCEITEHFEQRQPTISHHLRLLREASFIRGEKQGVWSYYIATELGKRAIRLLTEQLAP